jgi:hypothetical protein
MYQVTFMRALPLLLLCLSASCFAADSGSIEASRKTLLIHTQDKIQNETSAKSAAIAACPLSAKTTLYGTVTSLTKSPVTIKDKLERGDSIWVVEVMNSAANDLCPIPDGIYWVRAKDGMVFEVGPKP